MAQQHNPLLNNFPESCFDAPPFWVGGLQECHDFMRSLPGIEIMELGKSAGGRPILAGAYGAREPLERTSTSFSSSMGGFGKDAWDLDKFYPPSFFGSKPRAKPAWVFQGNIHGSEISGTVAAMNLLNLLARGVDLRGQRHDRLLEEARRMRIVVIPHANPDGRARWEPAKHLLTVTTEQQQRLTQGYLADGTPLRWPSSKSLFPIPQGGILGTYFNDDGINLNHDRFLDSRRAPETDALLRFYLEEMPDLVILSHSDQGSWVNSASEYVPVEIQTLTARIAGAVALELRRRKMSIILYPHNNRPNAGSRAFTQVDAVYHQCGALPLLIEFPTGVDWNPYTFEQVLDGGLAALETIMIFGNDIGFRLGVRKHLTDGRVIQHYGPIQ